MWSKILYTINTDTVKHDLRITVCHGRPCICHWLYLHMRYVHKYLCTEVKISIYYDRIVHKGSRLGDKFLKKNVHIHGHPWQTVILRSCLIVTVFIVYKILCLTPISTTRTFLFIKKNFKNFQNFFWKFEFFFIKKSNFSSILT